MNPWYLAAILAGAAGVAALSASASAQANAAIPKVTNWGIIVQPEPGVNGQWDFWVTGLDGKTGSAMLAAVPGNQQIYIPAATIQSQPTTTDFKYTFTPKGATAPFTIIVPAALLQAYASEPKTEWRKNIFATYTATRRRGPIVIPSVLTPQVTTTAPATCSTDVTSVINRAQTIINGFPADGSDSSAYASWMLTTAIQVPSVIGDINTVINCINQGSATGDISMLQALLAKLLPLVSKATQLSASSTSSSDVVPSDQTPPPDQTVPTDGGSTS